MAENKARTGSICGMIGCWKPRMYRCTPPVEGFSSVDVCEAHMPHWRDKYYKIEKIHNDRPKYKKIPKKP